MGIKDLYPVIKSVAPDQILSYNLSEFTGYRFAVDISVFLYKYIRSAGPTRWMSTFILLLCTLKKHGIKAVCIFDGPNPPIEKLSEQERRRNETQKAIDRLAECTIIKDKLQSDKNPVVDKLLSEKCKKLISIKRGCVDTTNYYDVDDIIDALEATIEKLEIQTLLITDVHRDTAFEIVEMMGLCAIKADGEAETVCSYLAINGIVDAILTEDTDVLAYGTPLMVAFKEYKLGEEKLSGIYLPSLLKEMDMNQDEFRDLCILLSCDYNNRVKGFPPDGKKHKKACGIGAKGALCMIQEYRRLEEVCKYVEDPEPLKYERCRELLSIPKYMDWNHVPYNIQPNYVVLEKFIKDNRLNMKLEYIIDCYEPTTINFCNSDSDSETYSDSE